MALLPPREVKPKPVRTQVYGLPGATEAERLVAKAAALKARAERDATLKVKRIAPDTSNVDVLRAEITRVLAEKEMARRNVLKKGKGK
jgi:hypothetical protein